MSKKLGDGRVIRKGSGTPFSSPRPPSLALLVEQREQEQVGEHSEKPCHLFATPFPPRMERAKKQPGQLLVRSSSSFIFARFLDPPATKSQLIYNDPIFTLPLPPAEDSPFPFVRVYLSIRGEKEKGGKKGKLLLPASDNSLFIPNETEPCRLVPRPPTPLFFSPSDHDSSPRTRSSGL